MAAVPQWIEQAEAQVQLGTLPRSWLARGVYSAQSLKEMTWFRGRVGLHFAFLEDTLLNGLLASRGRPGRQARIWAAAEREEADKLAAERGRLEEGESGAIDRWPGSQERGSRSSCRGARATSSAADTAP